MSAAVVVSDGCGSWTIEDGLELWGAVWRVVAYAIDFASRGTCRCGCTVAACDYCAHECGPDAGGRAALTAAVSAIAVDRFTETLAREQCGQCGAVILGYHACEGP
jgi:hypothetical protein